MNMPRTSAMGTRFLIAIVCISWCQLAFAQELKPRAILEGHKDSVISLAYSPDGKTLASGSDDVTIRIWDVATGKSTATLEESHPHSLHFTPDGKILATVNLEIGMWDIATRKRRKLTDEKWMWCERYMGCFSPDGKLLATGGVCFPEIGLWDVKTGKLIRLLEEKTLAGISLFHHVRITPDGKTLLAYSSIAGLRKWDVATGKSLPVVDLPKSFRVEDLIDFREGAISPDCKLLAVSVPSEYAAKDGQEVKELPAHVAILDVATGKPTATLGGSKYNLIPLVFSKDGKTLAAGSDSVALFWDIATSKEIGSLKTDDDVIQRMALSPDGKTLATAGYEKNTIRLWDVPAKK